ncbi:amino acid ABC transporter ATP-binding protein [Fusobacterium varium]
MIIQVNNLSKQYLEGDVILKNINLGIEKGEVVSIIGPSGGGKSTLLRCLIGLEEIDSGDVKVPDKKKMGMVFQSFNLFPHKTAIQNIMESLIVVDKMDKSEAKKIAYDLLEKVGLKDRADFYPKALSGGQKQRVAIARALARNPEVLLFDEPTSALDPDMVKEVLNVIEQLRDSSNITMVMVSHEIDFVNQISDRIVVMENGNIKDIVVNKKKRQVS